MMKQTTNISVESRIHKFSLKVNHIDNLPQTPVLRGICVFFHVFTPPTAFLDAFSWLFHTERVDMMNFECPRTGGGDAEL